MKKGGAVKRTALYSPTIPLCFAKQPAESGWKFAYFFRIPGLFFLIKYDITCMPSVDTAYFGRLEVTYCNGKRKKRLSN